MITPADSKFSMMLWFNDQILHLSFVKILYTWYLSVQINKDDFSVYGNLQINLFVYVRAITSIEKEILHRISKTLSTHIKLEVKKIWKNKYTNVKVLMEYYLSQQSLALQKR